MEYRLELKPFEKKDGFKYKVIQITDVMLHTSKKQVTTPGKEIKRAMETHTPGRIYNPIEKSASPDKNVAILDLLKNDPDFVKMIRDEEARGYKILIEIPSEGIPVYAGKDTVEFINSKNGKRILRGLAKKKSES